jgi:chloride channel 7
MGATGILSGYSRLTFSLVVLMMETAENVNLFMPVLVTCLSSIFVAEIFGPSLYVVAIRGKGMPYLTETVPIENRRLRAADIMAKNVIYIKQVESISKIYSYLENTKHNAFPVLNEKSQLIGTISRNNLILMFEEGVFDENILEEKRFYPPVVEPKDRLLSLNN